MGCPLCTATQLDGRFVIFPFPFPFLGGLSAPLSALGGGGGVLGVLRLLGLSAFLPRPLGWPLSGCIFGRSCSRLERSFLMEVISCKASSGLHDWATSSDSEAQIFLSAEMSPAVVGVLRPSCASGWCRQSSLTFLSRALRLCRCAAA